MSDKNRENSADYLAQREIPFVPKNGGAHLIVEGKDCFIDFWPGTGKWHSRCGKKGFGVRNLVAFIEVWDEALALKKAAQAAPQAADSVTAPAPPPECETEAEKRAFAFGWFKALESERMKADNKKKDPL